MANTVIQLKFSEGTATPASLNVAEPAYSNNSNKLFIGLAGNQVIAIGGKYFTDLVDAATDANTNSTIVKRDASGMFSATAVKASLFGNANTSTILQTSRLIGVSGDIVTNTVSFNGSTDANLNVTLSATGVTAGTYGGSTNAVVIVVDSKGRITSASNVATSSVLNIAGDSGTDAVSLSTDTITFVGGDGITTTAYSANSNVRFDVDNTIVRTSGGTISGDLAITGNLVVSGNTVTQDVETLIVEDSLIQLAANNAADAIDIGLFGQFVVTGNTKYTALFRDASDSGKYKLLTDGTEKPLAANTVNVSAFSTGTLVANITGGTVSGLTAAIAIADGGTNQTSFTNGIVAFNGTSLATLANTGTAGTFANASHVPVITTDAYGRVSAVSNTAIAIDTAAITSGTLPIARGGTNQTSYTTGAMLQFNGTSIASLANSSYTLTGGLAAANTITSLTVDSYGRVTAATGEAIAIAASQITSGTLGVTRGGTGVGSFTANSVLLSGTTSTSAVVSLNSSTEGHVLQVSSAGVPVFGFLNGGSF